MTNKKASEEAWLGGRGEEARGATHSGCGAVSSAIGSRSRTMLGTTPLRVRAAHTCDSDAISSTGNTVRTLVRSSGCSAYVSRNVAHIVFGHPPRSPSMFMLLASASDTPACTALVTAIKRCSMTRSSTSMPSAEQRSFLNCTRKRR